MGQPTERLTVSPSVRPKYKAYLLWVIMTLVLSSLPALAQARSQMPRQPGSISGRVVDQSGAGIVGAPVRLATCSQLSGADQQSRDGLIFGGVAVTDEDGRFAFSNVVPGLFHLEVNFDGFAPQTVSGELGSGEVSVIPQITLTIATAATELVVTPPSSMEIAEQQIKEEEKQRVLGILPNFYVTYVHDAAPLTPKQKFELAWKSTVDPVNFAVTGAVAGLQQAQNDFGGYGQGGQGYAKRYGASFADSVTGTFIGGAVLPSLLKQDPRYFYSGTGSVRSRVLYALAKAVICKGDNGRWQANYSSILGNLAAGGISNLYYPDEDRNGVKLTVETALIGIGATAATNLLQEFVIRKLTPAAPNHQAGKTQSFIVKVSGKLIREGD